MNLTSSRSLMVMMVALFMLVALPCLAVASMGTDVMAQLSSVPDAKSAETKGFYMGGPVPGDSYAWGNCTYWAYAMRYWAGDPISTTWGNANTWAAGALIDGYLVDHTPAVNAVFQTGEGALGHVAYVINVDAVAGTWTISEMNAPHLNVVSQRTFTMAAAQFYTFIHDKKGAAPWTSPAISPPSSPTGNLLQ